MEETKIKPNERIEKYDAESLAGTLFSTIVFVGGGIIIFIVLLFVLYMMRV